MKRHRGRPRLTVQPQVINIKLRLHPGEDEDLLSFLSGVPDRRRASAVKMAMRSGNLARVDTATLQDDDDFEELLF